MIEGESLVNDGSAIVVFEIFMVLVFKSNDANAANEPSVDALFIIELFARLALGGFALGILMGIIINFIIKHTENNVMEVNIILCSV